MDSDSTPTGLSAGWLLRIPDAKSSGFSVAVLQLRLFKDHVPKPQFGRGTLEIAVFNPCPEPIAVPVILADPLFHKLLKHSTSFELNTLGIRLWLPAEPGEQLLLGGLGLAAKADRKDSYQVLYPHEAIVYVLHFQIALSTMSKEAFLSIAPNLRMRASYAPILITPKGSAGRDGWYHVPCEPPPVPVAVDN